MELTSLKKYNITLIRNNFLKHRNVIFAYNTKA
jgi:hypothetical protein